MVCEVFFFSIVRGNSADVDGVAEPLFFLHHPQIDRLWWTWQQQDPARRLVEYSGQHLPWGGKEFVPASSNDTLNMLGLAEDVLVRDVLSTTGPLLCYRY